ncbi:twin-arginine translocase subunit TatC [Ammoniphilus resinae]|uniref:Sec-independent protein translocase protein TatC n=1 Tax=Ammoniphilus resinae TaxID=861532 RepID=A0ABS4GUI0_9BACL|nr:twin-arginine translocase subunit TatC [Ammoniphilus resinae]MBP1933933.1 sec-independent protein translocase protein TatC [Ammoniphilus resinae]
MKDPIDRAIPWTEHLEELRKRIIFSAIYFFIATIIGFVYSADVVNLLKSGPVANQMDWHVFAISDALSVYIKVSIVIGVILSLPFLLYQLWAFVRPGLRIDEQKVALRFIPAATLLFLVGISFAYFVLFPMVLNFMLVMTKTLQAEETYGIMQFFSFLFSIVMPFGVLFELPIIVMFLTRIRILNPMRLAKARKIAYFLLVIIAVTITPPEFVSDFLVTIPLLLLYEFSIWLSKGVYKKQLKEDEEFMKEERAAE